MRFSLGTLVLVVLWLGALAVIWTQREPWVRMRYLPAQEAGTILPHRDDSEIKAISPDASRRVEIRHADNSPDCAVILDIGASVDTILWQVNGNFYDAHFADDNTLRIDDYTIMWTFRRRRPEWWWGHFYRPEVWCAIVLSVVLVWRFWKRIATWRRARERS